MNRYLDWLRQAERDLERAQIDIQYEYWEWACFASQHAAEKACKALLMKHGHSAWGHALTPMFRSMKEIDIPQDIFEFAQLLDVYYIPTRYPDGFSEGIPADYFNENKAHEAVRAAREIGRFCKDHLA